MTLACLDYLASQSCTELGPAQPQLVSCYYQNALQISVFPNVNVLCENKNQLMLKGATSGYCNGKQKKMLSGLYIMDWGEYSTNFNII